MKIFLSSIEQATGAKGEPPVADQLIAEGVRFKWNLISYYYCKSGDRRMLAERVRDNSELMMVDSGAHSFQFGAKVDFDKYTDEYARFIGEFDRPNVVGYFEMDIDNVVGYDEVRRLRSKLEAVSDKIIPVWHRNRGVDEFKRMCEEYSGRVVSITGFKDTDIRDDQYAMFLKYAKSRGCKVHCLGMTRRKILDKVPFDYVDSSSWAHNCMFGKYGSEHTASVDRAWGIANRGAMFKRAYLDGMKMQEHYWFKWRKVCKD